MITKSAHPKGLQTSPIMITWLPDWVYHLCHPPLSTSSVCLCVRFCRYLSSLFLNCIQNDVTSQRLSWNLGLKTPKPLLLLFFEYLTCILHLIINFKQTKWQRLYWFLLSEYFLQFLQLLIRFFLMRTSKKHFWFFFKEKVNLN